MNTKKNIKFAAVDRDQPVLVWGLGETEDEALEDSCEWRDGGDEAPETLPLSGQAREYLARGGDATRLTLCASANSVTAPSDDYACDCGGADCEFLAREP